MLFASTGSRMILTTSPVVVARNTGLLLPIAVNNPVYV